MYNFITFFDQTMKWFWTNECLGTKILFSREKFNFFINYAKKIDEYHYHRPYWDFWCTVGLKNTYSFKREKDYSKFEGDEMRSDLRQMSSESTKMQIFQRELWEIWVVNHKWYGPNRMCKQISKKSTESPHPGPFCYNNNHQNYLPNVFHLLIILQYKQNFVQKLNFLGTN